MTKPKKSEDLLKVGRKSKYKPMYVKKIDKYFNLQSTTEHEIEKFDKRTGKIYKLKETVADGDWSW